MPKPSTYMYEYFDSIEKRDGLDAYKPFVNYAINRAKMTPFSSLKQILVVNALMAMCWDETLKIKGRRK